MKVFYGGVRYHSGFLRREMTVEFPVVAAFIPSLHFSEARDAAERGDGIAFVHIDGRLKERWRSSVEHDAGVGPLCFDTIVRPTTGRSVISTLKLTERLVRFVHIHGSLKMQPRGEKVLQNGRPAPLLVSRRFGVMFVTHIIDNIPFATRLCYYDKARSGEGQDQMGYAKSGWVVDEVSTDSPDFSQPGGRIGYYPLKT